MLCTRTDVWGHAHPRNFRFLGVLSRGKRNVWNILIFVRLYSIPFTIKEYSFSKKGRVYMRKPRNVLDIISNPAFKVVSCHFYSWNLEFTAAWYIIFLKVSYQLFVQTLKEYSVIRSFAIRDDLEHSF